MPGAILSGCMSADPHNFTCGRYLETLNERQVLFDYPAAPGIKAIRQHAGGDFKQQGGLEILNGKAEGTELGKAERSAAIDMLSEAIDAGNAESFAFQGEDGDYKAILVLSGGGQWGAFGAGYLAEWKRNLSTAGHQQQAGGQQEGPPPGAPAFTAVTGISTGALQALFASVGDFDAVEKAYDIEEQNDIVIDQGIRGAVRKGASFDTVPLVKRITSRLCNVREGDTVGFACPRLQRIARSNTKLLIGIVNGDTGDLQIVNVTHLLQNHYPIARDEIAEYRLANCVTGVAMASAAVPAQLRPVRIDGKTYVDGGVRAAVVSNFVGESAKLSASKPEVFVIRNGPTVIPPADKSKRDSEVTGISDEPTILRVALRSYSAIVNQNEMSSIAELTRIYKRPIFLATADGFDNPEYNGGEKCGYSAAMKSEAKAFNPSFMQCLTKWGQHKYRNIGWLVIEENLDDPEAQDRTKSEK